MTDFPIVILVLLFLLWSLICAGITFYFVVWGIGKLFGPHYIK